MPHYGFIFVYIGVSWAAYAACLHPAQMHWFHFFLGASIALIGIYILHGSKKFLDSAERISDSQQMRDFAIQIELICTELKLVEKQFAQLPLHDVAEKHHQLIETKIFPLRDYANAIANLFGMTTYSDVISMCSTGERYLRRSLTAALDEHSPESHTYLLLALKKFQRIIDYLNLIRTQNSAFLQLSFHELSSYQRDIRLSLNRNH
ncbi:MAG: hypothetical protein OXT67_06295 [Zetaproteobacteria bacterium]|nr:hypothetical protein [Zetaproteobacteria bacterium]